MKNKRFGWTVIIAFIVILTIVFVVMLVYYKSLTPTEISGNTIKLMEDSNYVEEKVAEEELTYETKKETTDLKKIHNKNSDLKRMDKNCRYNY